MSWVLPPDTSVVAHLAAAACRSKTADDTLSSVTTADSFHHCDDYLTDAPWCNEDDYAFTQAPDSNDDRDLDEDSDVWDPGGESAFDSPSYYGC